MRSKIMCSTKHIRVQDARISEYGWQVRRMTEFNHSAIRACSSCVPWLMVCGLRSTVGKNYSLNWTTSLFTWCQPYDSLTNEWVRHMAEGGIDQIYINSTQHVCSIVKLKSDIERRGPKVKDRNSEGSESRTISKILYENWKIMCIDWTKWYKFQFQIPPEKKKEIEIVRKRLLNSL